MLVSPASVNTRPLAPLIHVTREQVESYARLFINQPYYAQMTGRIGEHATFYRPQTPDKQPVTLTVRTLHEHLTGRSTLMFYAINPSNQMAKWLCVDADYPNSGVDLARIQDRLAKDQVHSVFEDSRRGGHLWVLFSEPLPAVQVRRYIHHVLAMLTVPLAAGPKNPGVEIYPRQDAVSSGSYGNGVRGPFGIHRKDGVRYWFRGVEHDLESQMRMLEALPKLTPDQLNPLLGSIPQTLERRPKQFQRFGSRDFSIFDHFPAAKANGRYEVQCPSCKHHHLAITVGGPKDGFYVCFNGCATTDIRAALGQPVPEKYRRAA